MRRHNQHSTRQRLTLEFYWRVLLYTSAINRWAEEPYDNPILQSRKARAAQLGKQVFRLKEKLHGR